jgi:hypothetical protein
METQPALQSWADHMAGDAECVKKELADLVRARVPRRSLKGER